MARFLGPQLIHKLKAGANRIRDLLLACQNSNIDVLLHEHFHHKVESLGFRLHTNWRKVELFKLVKKSLQAKPLH